MSDAVPHQIVEFLGADRLAGHIREVQATYRRNRDAMVAALRAELPDAQVDVPWGGFYLWLTLPDGCDGDAVARAAADRGVIVLPGSKFFAGSGSGHPRNHLRVAYSHATSEEILEGMRKLGDAYRAVSRGSVASVA